MHINATGFIAVILSMTGYMLTVKYLAARSRRKIIFAMIIGSGLAMPGMGFAMYYFHIIPEMKCYYDFRSIPGVELLTMFVGIAAGAYAVILPKRYRYLALVAALLLSAGPYIKPLLFPLEKDKLRAIVERRGMYPEFRFHLWSIKCGNDHDYAWNAGFRTGTGEGIIYFCKRNRSMVFGSIITKPGC